MALYIVPVFIIFIFIFAFAKNTDAYGGFVKGAKDAIKLIFEILPYIVAILVAVKLFEASGLLKAICDLFAPLFTLLGVPNELAHFIFLKPFSGAGSIALFNDIVATYGADSYISRVASIIAGSSDTVFYIATIYFSKTNIKKLGLAIPIALFCTFFSAILASWVCKIF
ncbi:MAG: spore maturation protein [Clostridia bacterium]|nr:spore maturation protein [Clostridia bacterium]